MNKKLFSIVLSTLSVAGVVRAEEEVSVIKRPMEVYEGSSEALRMNKQFTATLGLTGISAGNGPGTGVSLGYHLSRNQIVLIDFRSGDGATKRSSEYSYGSSSYSATTDAKVTQVGAHYKQFFGNSFYLRGGVDYSKVKYDYKWKYNSNYFGPYNNTSDYGFDGTALLGNVAIGNQWQWENFTLGCDWIGISSSLAHKLTRDEISANADEIDKKNYKEDKGSYLTGGSLIALRLYLGATF